MLAEQRSPRPRGLDVGYVVVPRMVALVIVLIRVGDTVVVLGGFLVGREGEIGALR